MEIVPGTYHAVKLEAPKIALILKIAGFNISPNQSSEGEFMKRFSAVIFTATLVLLVFSWIPTVAGTSRQRLDV